MRVREFDDELLNKFSVISQLFVQISAHLSTVSEFGRSQIFGITSKLRRVYQNNTLNEDTTGHFSEDYQNSRLELKHFSVVNSQTLFKVDHW